MQSMKIEEVEADTTKHLACREGDIFAWVYFSGGFFGNSNSYDIRDVWVMEAGDFVTKTNRIEDLPEWLIIHPTKLGGANIRKWKELKNYKYDHTLESSILETVWEVDVYNYLIWAGDRNNLIVTHMCSASTGL